MKEKIPPYTALYSTLLNTQAFGHTTFICRKTWPKEKKNALHGNVTRVIFFSGMQEHFYPTHCARNFIF